MVVAMPMHSAKILSAHLLVLVVLDTAVMGLIALVRCFLSIDHFTVLCLVTWPFHGSEAEGDLALIQTSLLLLCKST